MIKCRFEIGLGPFPEEVYPELRQEWWKWPDGPAFFVVAHDARAEYPKPIGIFRIFTRKLLWTTPASNPQKGLPSPARVHELRAAAIGGVFVADGYRGKAVGFQLLIQTIEFLKTRREYDVAILHSRERSLYRHAGFKPIGGDLWGVHLHGRLHHLDNVDPNEAKWEIVPEGHF